MRQLGGVGLLAPAAATSSTALPQGDQDRPSAGGRHCREDNDPQGRDRLTARGEEGEASLVVSSPTGSSCEDQHCDSSAEQGCRATLEERATSTLVKQMRELKADFELLRSLGARSLAWVTAQVEKKRVALLRRSSGLPFPAIGLALRDIRELLRDLLLEIGEPMPCCLGRPLLYVLAREAVAVADKSLEAGEREQAYGSLPCP